MTRSNSRSDSIVLTPGLAARIFVLAPLSGLYRLILWLVQYMDDDLAIKVVYLLIWPFLLLFRGQRRINLRRLLLPAGRTKAQCNESSKKYVWHHARLILEAARLSSMTPEQIRQRVIFDGEEYLTDALKKGRGALLVGNHVGNWLFSVGFLSIAGYKVSAVAYEIPINSIQAHMRSLALRCNPEITNVGCGAPAAALRAFKKNEVFLAMTDVSLRPIRGKWLHLGHVATINVDTGPAKLALMTDAPILHLSNHRQSDSRFVISISPEIERTDDPDNLTQLWLDELHKEILSWPEQWWLLTFTHLLPPIHARPLPVRN